MTSLSRIIKSRWTAGPAGNEKVIEVQPFPAPYEEEISEEVQQPDPRAEAALRQAEDRAAALLAKAKQEAGAIRERIADERARWEHDRENYAEQARQEGYKDGFQHGSEEARRQYSTLIDEARNVVEETKKAYIRHLEESELVILQLGIKTAERIIGEELQEEPSKFFSLVKRALKEAREYKEVQIHVHPSQYGLLNEGKQDLLTVFPADTELYIYPNEDIGELSCLIESENGRIDASVDSQLVEIKTKLLGMLEGESE